MRSGSAVHATACDGLPLVAGRVARVFARVRQERPANAARVLFSQARRDKGASKTLRPQFPANAETQMQPAPVPGTLVVRGRAAASSETVDNGLGGQRVRVERARAECVHLLSQHAVRQASRVLDSVQGQRKLFRNIRTEVYHIKLSRV